MQQLYLLRHAKAEPWSPLGNDFSRPLSTEGKHHAQALSSWMTKNLTPPDTVLCSPARRTRETLAPLLARWPQLLAPTDYVESIYGASLDMLLTIAGDAFSFSQRLLLVGHNPGFEALLVSVLQEKDAARIREMATGTLAIIEFSHEFKKTTTNGKLLHLIKRKSLSA